MVTMATMVVDGVAVFVVPVYFESGSQGDRGDFVEVFNESNVSQRSQHGGELTACILQGRVSSRR